MKLKNYQTSRYNDFGGGMNVRDSADSIEDKQGVFLKNFQGEGNKLVTMKGYELFHQRNGGPIQGIALMGKYIVFIWESNLYIYDESINDILTLSLSAVGSTTKKYNISTGKILNYWICITDIEGEEDLKLFKFDLSILINQSLTNLTNKKFTCSSFMATRLWLGGNKLAPSTLYTSNQGTPTDESKIYDFTNGPGYSSTIGVVGDSSNITGFTENNGDYYVFKRNSVYNVTDIVNSTASSSSAIILKRVTATGAINQQVIQNVDQDVLYFDGRNVRRLSYEVNTLALKDSSISSEIQPLIYSLPEEQKFATSTYVYPYYKLFLKDNFSNTNNIGLVYNIRDKGWSVQKGIYPACAVSGYGPEGRVSYIGNYDFGVLYREGEGVGFGGTPVNYEFISKKYAFGDNLDYKRLGEIELYGKISSGLKLYLDIILDDAVIDTREIYFENNLTPTLGSSTIGVATFGGVETTNQLNNFRYRYEYFNDGVFIQFRIRGTGVGYFELHGVNIESKFIKAYPIHY